MALEITHKSLADCRLMFPAISRLQTTLPFIQNMSLLSSYSDMGARITTAMDGSVIAGMALSLPVHKLKTGKEYAEEIGLDPEKCVLRALIYVHPDYRGQGLSKVVEDAARKGDVAAGKKVKMFYGYETPEILAWELSRPEFTDTGIKDYSGHPVLILNISE